MTAPPTLHGQQGQCPPRQLDDVDGVPGGHHSSSDRRGISGKITLDANPAPMSMTYVITQPADVFAAREIYSLGDCLLETADSANGDMESAHRRTSNILFRVLADLFFWIPGLLTSSCCASRGDATPSDGHAPVRALLEQQRRLG